MTFNACKGAAYCTRVYGSPCMHCTPDHVIDAMRYALASKPHEDPKRNNVVLTLLVASLAAGIIGLLTLATVNVLGF